MKKADRQKIIKFLNEAVDNGLTLETLEGHLNCFVGKYEEKFITVTKTYRNNITVGLCKNDANRGKESHTVEYDFPLNDIFNISAHKLNSKIRKLIREVYTKERQEKNKIDKELIDEMIR
jgi:hypothetical protein